MNADKQHIGAPCSRLRLRRPAAHTNSQCNHQGNHGRQSSNPHSPPPRTWLTAPRKYYRFYPTRGHTFIAYPIVCRIWMNSLVQRTWSILHVRANYQKFAVGQRFAARVITDGMSISEFSGSTCHHACLIPALSIASSVAISRLILSRGNHECTERAPAWCRMVAAVSHGLHLCSHCLG
jgi:hypothetical protein